MEDIGFIVDKALLAGHHKISDLLWYEGPILSHFRDDAGDNYLYYWVDQDENSFRWLIVKVTLSQLKSYLESKVSLRETILSEENQYLFLADYLNHGVENHGFDTVRIVDKRILTSSYIPEVQSYYKFEIPQLYNAFFSQMELSQTAYLQTLKEKTVYIKFSETDKKHLHILSLDSLTALLGSLKKSYNSYIEDAYKKNFLSLYTSLNDLTNAIQRVKDNLQLRLVDTKISSFGIGVSVDTIMLNKDIRSDVLTWSKSIIDDYKNEVIELDYDNPDAINYIIKNYSPDARKNIFKPILDIYTNPKYQVFVSNKNFEDTKAVRRPNKNNVVKITETAPTLINTKQQDKEFVTIAVEVEKGQQLDKIPKKLVSQPLFEKRSDSIEITKTSLNYDNFSLQFKSPLVLSVSIKEGIHLIENSDIGISIETKDLNVGLEEIAKSLAEQWNKYHDLTTIQLEEAIKKNEVPVQVTAVLTLIEHVIRITS